MFLQSAEKFHPTKMPFFPEQVACSTPTALLAAVTESCKNILEPPPWRVHLQLGGGTQPQFEDCYGCDNYDVGATLL